MHNLSPKPLIYNVLITSAQEVLNSRLLCVCWYVCLLVGLCKYYWLDLHEKERDESWSTLDPINFESDLDRLVTKI